MPPRCRVISQWISLVGLQGTALPVHPPKDVYACCWNWAEGSREVSLPQPQAWSPKAGPRGGCICHPPGRVLGPPGRNSRPFHQVYMLKRLPRSPPCRPKQVQEVTRDILSTLKDCLRWRRGGQPGGSRAHQHLSILHWDRASQRERQDTLGKWELGKAREAHQWLWQPLPHWRNG